MSYDLILENISKHILLNEQESGYFISLLSYREVRKKELLLKEGQTCKHISYVHSGALRAYHLGNGQKESTIMFAIADWWVTDMYCFANQKPAMMHIEAIEDSCIFQLSKQKLDGLFMEIPKFEKYFRILMQNAYIREQLRVLQNLSMPAEERYNNFLVKYPQISKQVAQKQIASYLGITPEFLSTIRKNKTKPPIS
ncbi:MAG: Crp/Fnr family transcriptional regulator [Bacteroidetes bacterium]|nr:Crp/Fnr family transcriptional regulator [Bacteroidota bacterium]